MLLLSSLVIVVWVFTNFVSFIVCFVCCFCYACAWVFHSYVFYHSSLVLLWVFYSLILVLLLVLCDLSLVCCLNFHTFCWLYCPIFPLCLLYLYWCHSLLHFLWLVPCTFLVFPLLYLRLLCLICSTCVWFACALMCLYPCVSMPLRAYALLSLCPSVPVLLHTCALSFFSLSSYWFLYCKSPIRAFMCRGKLINLALSLPWLHYLFYPPLYPPSW